MSTGDDLELDLVERVLAHLREQQLARLRAEATPMTHSGDGIDLRQARWSAARLPPDRGEQPSLFD